jgi:4'-phosphopantetheinyl transferase
MQSALSEPELARARRFGRTDLRDRYVVGRATLRAILGAALDVDPSRVTIVRGQRGRPMVEGGQLDFNVSHTLATAIFAVTRGARVGIDIEHRDRALNVDGVARKFMSPGEQAMLEGLAGDLRRHTLLRLWTCKEAMSKATGDGIAAAFRQIDVTLGPTLRVNDGPAPYRPPAWTLVAAPVPDGYIATVALWDRAAAGAGPALPV